jgi:hypothetical protein
MKAIIFIGTALDNIRCKNECYYQAKKWNYKLENIYFLHDYDCIDSEEVQKLKNELISKGFKVTIDPNYL